MIVEFRHLLAGAGSVVGNLWTVLEFWPRASLAGAADIRRWLPEVSKEMIEWHLGQAMNPLHYLAQVCTMPLGTITNLMVMVMVMES